MGLVIVSLGAALLSLVWSADAHAQTKQSPEKDLVEQLRMGLPPAEAVKALSQLEPKTHKKAAPVILELLEHRRPQIRVAAVEALCEIKARGAESALLYALQDPDAEVREAAARGLGEIGSRRAIKALLAAHDRGVRSALLSVGKLARPNTVSQVLDRVDDGVVDPVAPALAAMLGDPRFPLRGKLLIIRGVASHRSPSARSFLLDWLQRFKEDGHPRLRHELFEALKQVDPAGGEPAASGEGPVAMGGKR